MTLRTIAEKAWKDAPQGLSTLDGFRVFKTRKMLLVHEAPYVERHFDNYLHKLVAFPRPEHLGQFASAAESVEAGGENKSNPGAIGELHFRVANSRIYLSFVQANFKVGKTGLPRNLATLYGGWRENSLRGLFQFAREKNLPVEVRAGDLWKVHLYDHLAFQSGRLFGWHFKRRFPWVARSPFEGQLKKIARELNMQVKDNRLPFIRKLVITPVQS